MTDKEKISILIDEMIKEAQEEPQWKAELALRCLKKELLEEKEPVIPKKAFWIHPSYDDCHCSICKRQPEHELDEDAPLYPYCPYCGAKMEVKWDDT